MTDHHDELASAYLDGHVSPEEAARVEADPGLMAEVDALAAVVERLQTEDAPVDPGMRQRHLSAAMAAFDQATAPTNVIPLDAAGARDTGGERPAPTHRQPDDIARRTARVASAPAGDRHVEGRRAQARRRQGLPSWLSAAAVLLVVGGGIGWFMSRQNQSDDTAASSFATDAAPGGAAESDAAFTQAAEDGAPGTTLAATGEVAKDSADNATAAGSAEAQAAVPAPAGTEVATTATTAAQPSTTTSRAITTAAPSSTPVTTPPGGGLTFASAPTGAEVEARLASTGQSPQPAAGSACGGVVTAPAGTTLTGYVPITVGGVAGEGLFYRAGPGSGTTTVLVVRTSSCQAFS